MKKVPFFSGTLVTLAASVFLVACDPAAEDGGLGWLVDLFWPNYMSSFDRKGEIDGPPLPDAFVDWEHHAREARDAGDCETYAQITFRATEWVNSEVDVYLEDIGTSDVCSGTENKRFREFAAGYHFPRTLNTQDLYPLLMSDNISEPISNARTVYEEYADDWHTILPGAFFEHEARWVRRCERPMHYAGAEFYHMRRGLAKLLDDDSFLIPEWEERRAECALIAAALLASLAPAREALESANVTRDLEDVLRRDVSWLTADE